MPEPYHCIPYPTPEQLAATPICEVTCADGLPPDVRLIPEPPAALMWAATFIGAVLLFRWGRRW